MTRFREKEPEQLACCAPGLYLEIALRTVAEQCGRTSTHGRDPGAVALEFPAIVAALVEAQSRLYLAKAMNYGMAGIAAPLTDLSRDLSVMLALAENAQSPGEA